MRQFYLLFIIQIQLEFKSEKRNIHTQKLDEEHELLSIE